MLPSGPSCMVTPCISVGWKNRPVSDGAEQLVWLVELAAGPSFVYSEPAQPAGPNCHVLRRRHANRTEHVRSVRHERRPAPMLVQTSPRYAEIRVDGETFLMCANTSS